MKILKEILLFIWQLPQNLCGLIWRTVFAFRIKRVTCEKTVKLVNVNAVISTPPYLLIRTKDKWYSNVSLGIFIFVYINESEDTINHEVNHYFQSRRFGIFYLPIILLGYFLRTLGFDSLYNYLEGIGDKK